VLQWLRPIDRQSIAYVSSPVSMRLFAILLLYAQKH
jgi:hypothetical protein